MSLKFIGLPPRKVTAITNFLKTLPTKENVDLEQHPKILRKCGEKFLHRRSCLFNQLVLWLAYYRELRYHIPDLSSLLDEFEVNANAVTRRAHMYPFRDPVKARPHLRTLEATVFGDDSRTDVTVIQNAMVGATALAKLSECQPLGTGEIEFIQLRQKDVMALEDSLLAISNNMFEIRPVKLHLERHSNSSLVNATNKLIYLGKVIVHVRTSWDILAEKCLIKIKELCKTLMKELRSCRSFESNYCSNIIKHKVIDGESADMLLEMLMEDFAIYEDIFPRSVSQSLGDPFSLEYDDEELHREWQKWLRGGWEGRQTKDDDDDNGQLLTTKKQERKVPDKSERQYAFSLLSPTKQSSQFWDTKPKTPHPVSKRVTFWSDDENQGRAKDETDDVKVDTLVDFDGGLGSLKLDDDDKPSTSTYKFELPKFIQTPILSSPFATQFSNPLFATGSSETIPGLETPLKEVSGLDSISDYETKTPPASDYSDRESSFSPNKRREVKSEAEISESEYEDIASGDGDEEASDAESVVSVASIPPATPVPPVSDPKAKRRLILKPKTKIIPKPKPSFGPFTSVTSPSTSVLKPRKVIKATPLTVDGSVLKPASFSAPIPGKDVTIVKVPTTTQTFTPGLTTTTSTKAQTASSTEVPGGRAQKMKAEPLTSPRNTPKLSDEAKLKDLLDESSGTIPVPDNVQAIIEKIKEDSRINEE
ncbi:Rh55 [macacine betaherpesvirus 3]|uniref:RhUL32 n=1 Tax=Rhesus cytomegalovirus (strain 68-1) TaxID=47929 RepID=Q2FAR5_RHCM6|nr:rhUL32 [macacine betaherpesvirus 3]APT39955.1 Rh55 [macacine betaherpesvirus 3]QXV50417.1 tegument protein pp150 [macacine betaherpesvirus 3]